MSNLPRPAVGEHAEYYGRYVALVPDGDILETLRDQLGATLELLGSIQPDRETYRYAPDKWTVREVIGHLLDTERLFAFRALAMARADDVVLPGMDQDVWAANSNAGDRQLVDMAQEWAALRRANVHMFAAFDASVGGRTGTASGFAFTVRSFPWIIAGHELWHRGLLQRDYLAAGE